MWLSNLLMKIEKFMKEQFPTDTYKYYATFSRLAFKLYQEGQAELITTLITSGVDLSGTIYTIEALLSNKPEYFSFQTNVWVCIANNANNPLQKSLDIL